MLRRGITVPLIMLAGVLASVGPASAQLLSTDWPMYMHDPQHTGKTTVLGPSSSSPALKWAYQAIGFVKSQPALGPDSTVYAGLKQGNPDGTISGPLCAWDSVTGALNWCTTSGAAANSSSPAIGTAPPQHPAHSYGVFIGARDNKLYAVNNDGSVAWTFKAPFDGDIMSSPVIASDGTAYMTCGCLSAGIVWALDANGALRWSFQITPGINNSAVTFSSKTPGQLGLPANVVRRLYVGGNDGSLWAIDDLGGANVQLAWSFTPTTQKKNKNYNSSPAVDLNGHIYWGTTQGFFVVRDDVTQGTLLWSKSVAGEVDATPAIDNAHQTVFVSSLDKKTRTLQAFDFSGNPAWTSVTGKSGKVKTHDQAPSPVIDSAGNVYAAFGPRVSAYSAAGTHIWDYTAGDEVTSMALGTGTLYFGARDHKLYAVTSH